MDTDVRAEVLCWLPRCNGLRDEVTIAKHFLPRQGRRSPGTEQPAARGAWPGRKLVKGLLFRNALPRLV